MKTGISSALKRMSGRSPRAAAARIPSKLDVIAPMRGSWLWLRAAVSLFLIGALAFGLLISTIADTQQVAFQIALLVSYLPTLMLSGFIFPISSMPAFLQALTTNPARVLGVEKTRGWIKPGMRADIVAVRDNPLDKIETVKDVVFVMRNGKVYKKP